MITLTSDFGLKDPYVAQIKGVIVNINPNAAIIDLSHDVEKYDIRMGAFMLASGSSYFPRGTVHLAVVDPGVGTGRRAIVVQTNESFFVGPDNGVLMLAAKNQGIKAIYELADPKFMLSNVSSTFHGRDIFAPAAAYLDKGVEPKKFGPKINDAVNPPFAKVQQKDGCFTVEVIYLDSFGNIITNLPHEQVPKARKVMVKLSATSLIIDLQRTYGEAKPLAPIALIGSHGFLEVALNQGNAAKHFSVKSGDRVKLTFS